MVSVLMGRVEPPVNVGVGTLMEVAEAYHARASEMDMVIRRAEADGAILKNSSAYKFRTGELRTFLEMTKRTIDMGSRRVTIAQMAAQMREYG